MPCEGGPRESLPTCRLNQLLALSLSGLSSYLRASILYPRVLSARVPRILQGFGEMRGSSAVSRKSLALPEGDLPMAVSWVCQEQGLKGPQVCQSSQNREAAGVSAGTLGAEMLWGHLGWSPNE